MPANGAEPKTFAPGINSLDGDTAFPVAMTVPEKSISGIEGLVRKVMGMRFVSIEAPGSRDAWEILIRTSVGLRAFIVPDGEGSSFGVEGKDAMVSLLIMRIFNSGAAKEVRLDHLVVLEMRELNVGWLQDGLWM
jgi:hypothetical protein